MFPVLSFAGLTIPMEPLFWVLAFSLGSEVGGRALGQLGANLVPSQQERWQGLYSQAIMIALVVGLLVARISYAFMNFSVYRTAPSLLFSIRPGTFAATPGLIAAAAVLGFWLFRRGVGLQHGIDATAVGVAAAMVMMKVGYFLTGTAYGQPTDMPWGVMLWGTVRHPVQLYEAISWLAIWLLLWGQLQRLQPGETFWRLLVGGSLSTLILDAFHATSPTVWVGVRVPQLVALGLLLLGLYVLSFYARSSQQKEGRDILPGEEGQLASRIDATTHQI